MAKELRLLCIAAALVVLSTASFAADYYVSPAGNDASPGTQAAPWKTISYAVSQSPAAGGDTIRVLPGTYEEIVPFKKSGAAEKPLILLSTEWGKALIRGRLLFQGSYINAEGFDVAPAKAPESAPPMGLVMLWGKNGKLINCLVHDNGTEGGCGIVVMGDDCEVSGCHVFNNGYERPDRTHGHGIYAGMGQRTLIENNFVFRNYSAGLHVFNGQGGDIVLRGNICFGMRGGALIMVGAGHPRAVVEKNFLYGDWDIKRSVGIEIGGIDGGCAEVWDNYVLCNPKARGDTAIGISGGTPLGPRILRNHVSGFYCYVNAPSGKPWALARMHLDENVYGATERLPFYVRREQLAFDAWQGRTGLDLHSRYGWKPVTETALYPDKHDASRFHLAVYQDDPAATVTVRSDLLKPFCQYRLENVSAMGKVAAAGVYDPAKGLQAPQAAGGIFNAYVVFVEPPVKAD